jgi:cation:H+ antiporter
MLIWFEFLFCLSIIGYAGYYLSRYGDIIAEKSGISASWIGLILLATATSLPELITGISAVTLADSPDIAVGEVLGSTVFNLAILVVLDALYRRESMYGRAAQGHILSAALGTMLIAFAGFSLLLDHAGMNMSLGFVGLYTPLIVLVYLVSMRAVYSYERRTLSEYAEASVERYPEVTLRSAVIGYAKAAFAVVLAGIWLPVIAKDISDMMGWGQSFVGTLLVAGVTSAPDLLGSNLFDIAVLAVTDVFYTKGPLLAHAQASHALTAFTAVMMSALVTVGLIFRPQKRVVLGLTWVSLGLLMLYVLNSWILFEHAQ